MADDNELKYETSGVFKGKLLEDMAVTVQKSGYLAIDVLLEDFWSEDDVHPLTKVPVAMGLLPLYKDDEVLVKFTNDSKLYPYLFYPLKPVFSPEEYKFPKSLSNTEFPSYSKEDQVPRIFKDLGHTSDSGVCLWSTDHYVILRAGNSFLSISDSMVNLYSDKPLYIQAMDKLIVEADTNKSVEVYCDKTSVKITKNSAELKQDRSSVVVKSSGVTLDSGKKVEVTSDSVTICGHLVVR